MPWPIRFGPEPRIITLGRSPRRTSDSRRVRLPGGVVVRRLGLELGRAGVDGLVGADALEGAVELAQLAQVPRVDAGAGADLAVGDAAPLQLEQHVVAVRARRLQPRQQLLVGTLKRRLSVKLARTQGFSERLAERAPDRHHLADRLHVRRERRVDARELLEREARPLHDDVVERRLEARGRGAGDVVGDLVERVADREPGGDLGDREAGGLRRQRGRPRHARVHLDHDDLVGRRVDRELHVGAAGLDADGADDGDRLVAQLLVGAVGQRLLRGDGDAVAGVDAHRVDVLDRADDHDVVRVVAHDLELELAPAEDRLVDQDLADRRGGEALRDDPLEVLDACGRCRRRGRRA